MTNLPVTPALYPLRSDAMAVMYGDNAPIGIWMLGAHDRWYIKAEAYLLVQNCIYNGITVLA